MLFRLSPEVLVLLIPVLLFALVFHEFSHGWVANKLGDPTAKNQGRLTLNPMAHLDPIGSMMILFVGFGWAKPVPVDSRYLANPRKDMMKIAFCVTECESNGRSRCTQNSIRAPISLQISAHFLKLNNV